MKRLGFIVFFLLVFVSSFSNKEEEPYCVCLDYYKNFSHYTVNEILEFRTAIQADEIAEFINHFYQENEIHDKLKLNLDTTNKFLRSPQIAFAKAKDTALINKAIINLLDTINELKFLWSFKGLKMVCDTSNYYALYAFKPNGNSEITSKQIDRARVSEDPYTDRIGVSFSFKREGAEKWGDFTAKNIGNYVAIISQNKVLSAPIINNPIRGGETIIDGGFSKKESEYFRNLLNCSSYSREISWEDFEKEMKKCE